MPPTPPPANLTGWQWIAFFAIVAGVTAFQSWMLHRKIDAAEASRKPATSNEEKPS